ncbi:MAG: hypothetical protein MUO94_06940 [Thermoplasmata archaeon]|nr:hypothetical protein [Thermoplasmata archaeon]
MKQIGILTEDPRTYFLVLEALRERGLLFASLDFGEPVPANIGVVISTAEEAPAIPFDEVVTDGDPDRAIERALHLLAGGRRYEGLWVGIDPGARPGIATVGDGVVLTSSTAPSPESVSGMVVDIADRYPHSKLVVRLGHGDRTNRDRIFNSLWDQGYHAEIVDERNTTTRSQTPDEDAAISIAMTSGYRPCRRQILEPGPGEIRNIQRLSRLESHGELTVSKILASKVAVGEISLQDAIECQRSRQDVLPRTGGP